VSSILSTVAHLVKDVLRDAPIAKRMMGDFFQVGPVVGSIAQNPAHGLVKMNVEVNFLNHLVEMFGQFLDLLECSAFARRKEDIEALFWRKRNVTLRFNRNVCSMVPVRHLRGELAQF
jgi:hypothetical protein